MASLVPTGGATELYAAPPVGATYPLLLRGESYAWWRSLGGVLLAPALWVLLGGVVSAVVLGLAWSIGHQDMDRADFLAAAREFQFWEGMLSAHLEIALLIPICIVLMRSVHWVRPGYLWSVEGRPRWLYLAACFGVAVGVFAAYVGTLPLRGSPLHWQPQEGLLPFLVVIVVVGPLQAAAEEFFFRGYLLQGLGSLVANPWFGVVASALVFAFFPWPPECCPVRQQIRLRACGRLPRVVDRWPGSGDRGSRGQQHLCFCAGGPHVQHRVGACTD